MRIRSLATIAILVAPLLLAGCRGTREVGLEAESPTVTAGVVEPGPTSATISATPALPDPTAAQATSTLTSIPEPTCTTTASPTRTPTPQPTETPVPTSPGTAPNPKILSFSVSPAEAWPGEAVTLTWEAQGDRATVCPSARYVLFTSDDCWQAPLSGSKKFTIPPAAASFPGVDFTLTVEATGPAASVTGHVSVAIKCDLTWFFWDEPQAGICPLEPVHTYAAAQRFQRGTMIWLEAPGRYYVLQDTPLYEDAERSRLDVIADPLEITGDTSPAFQAPEGLYAPVSGFGLVWRGDVPQSPGFHEQLGWGLAPEFGYEAILQCDNAAPSGGRTWQTCYLKGPDGEVIVLHPLGGWQLWIEP